MPEDQAVIQDDVGARQQERRGDQHPRPGEADEQRGVRQVRGVKEHAERDDAEELDHRRPDLGRLDDERAQVRRAQPQGERQGEGDAEEQPEAQVERFPDRLLSSLARAPGDENLDPGGQADRRHHD